MQAVKNNIGIYIDPDQILIYLERGYMICEDDGTEIENPGSLAVDAVTTTINLRGDINEIRA
jgi:hypothetical protein